MFCSVRILLVMVFVLCGNAFCAMRPVGAADFSRSDPPGPEQAQGNRIVVSDPAPGSVSILDVLTEEERAWLRRHPVIRVAQDSGWPPIEFTDDSGVNTGMTADYLRLIERRLGLRFERVRGLSWQESYARLKRWDIDMTTSVAVTPERTEFWAFTQPYMKVPIVIYTQNDVAFIADMSRLAGKSVAVVDGYAVSDWIPRDFPDIPLTRVKSTKEGLDRLQRREVFAFIDNMLVVGYLMAKLQVTNVKIAGETPYQNAQCMAVRKDWPILAGILQKALDSISETEREEIYRKWTPVRYEHGFDYTLLWQTSAVFVLVLLFLVVWGRRLLREIRDRKRAEAALMESEKRYKEVLNNVGAYVFMKDMQYRYTFVNSKVCDLFGHKEEDILGKGDEAFFSISSVEEIMRSDRPVIERGETVEREEKDLSSADKRPRTYWTVKIPLRDSGGKIHGLCGISTDMSARRDMEEALRRHEERFRTSFDADAIGRALTGIDGRFLHVNSRLCEMLGYGAEELPSLSFSDVTHPEDLAASRECVRCLLAGERSSYRFEKRYVRKDGAVVTAEVTATLVCDEQGRPVHFVTGVQDISERKRAEERLLESLSELRRFRDTVVDRELVMIELKKEVNALLKLAGREEKYTIAE